MVTLVREVKITESKIDLEVMICQQKTRIHLFYTTEFMDIPERYIGRLAFELTRSAVYRNLIEDANAYCGETPIKLIRAQVIQRLILDL